MAKRFIVLEGKSEYQFDSIDDIVKGLIDPNFYTSDEKQRSEMIKRKALANCIGNNCTVRDNYQDGEDTAGKIYIENENMYILSLLRNERLFLLEEKLNPYFSKGIEPKKDFNGYVLVNQIVEQLYGKFKNLDYEK